MFVSSAAAGDVVVAEPEDGAWLLVMLGGVRRGIQVLLGSSLLYAQKGCDYSLLDVSKEVCILFCMFGTMYVNM